MNLEERREAYVTGAVFRNPFDEGWRKNLRRIFGGENIPWYRSLLPSTHKPPDPKYPFVLEDQEMRLYGRV